MDKHPRELDTDLDLQTVAALSLWGGLGMLTLGALARRGADSFASNEFGVVLTVFIATLTSLGAWSLFHWSKRRGDTARRMLDGLLSLVPPAVLGVTLATGSSAFTLCLIVLFLALGGVFILMGELVQLGSLQRSLGGQASESNPPSSANDAGRSVSSSSQSVERNRDPLRAGRSSHPHDVHPHETGRAAPPMDHVAEAVWPSGLLQRVIRSQDESGAEHIEAVVVACFAAGERDTVIHLPLHPPLPGTPVCETEPLGDVPVDIQVNTARPYGVRLDVRRLGDTSASARVPVGLQMTAVEASANAA